MAQSCSPQRQFCIRMAGNRSRADFSDSHSDSFSSSGRSPLLSCLEVHHGQRSLTSTSRPTRRSSLHVGFAEELEVWIGPEEQLACTRSMPSWTTSPVISPHGVAPISVERMRSTGNMSLQRPRVPQVTPQFPGLTPSHFGLMRSWLCYRMRGALMTTMTASLFLSTPISWTIRIIDTMTDHVLCGLTPTSLSGPETSICLVWEDFVDTSIPIDVTIVRPEPPSFPLRGTIATVIVHQRATPDTAAALITTVHIADPVTHFTECAHSFTRFADSDTILQAARADQLCRERLQQGFGPCTIHSGTAQLLDRQWHQLHHGIGLHIRIPPALDEAELEQNLVRRVRRRQLQHPQQPQHAWNPPEGTADPEDDHPPHADAHQGPEDEVSFMARRPQLALTADDCNWDRNFSMTFMRTHQQSNVLVAPQMQTVLRAFCTSLSVRFAH